MKILDVSAGKRQLWLDKKHPFVTFVDIRPGVKPDVVADTRGALPFADSTYDLAVFDPPHRNFGKAGRMGLTYGYITCAGIRELVEATGRELYRVLKPNGLLAFRWTERDLKLAPMLLLLHRFEPLFGHLVSERTKSRSSLYWVMLRSTK